MFVSFYLFLNRMTDRLFTFHRCVFKGFWLGVLRRKSLYRIDEKYYAESDSFREGGYITGGLFRWEEDVIEKYFQSKNDIMVVGAGSGREIQALLKKGFNAEGFECNPVLVHAANRALENTDYPQRIQLCTRDRAPESEKMYDGILIGWTAYIHIKGRQARIRFLKQLYDRLKPASPLCVSFWERRKNTRQLSLIKKTAALTAAITGNDKPEFGDSLSPGYTHNFSRTEIKEELESAGFRMEHYENKNQAYAIGIKD